MNPGRVLHTLCVAWLAISMVSCSTTEKEKVAAEEGDRQNGIYRKRYPNDTISHEISYKNGKMDGEAKQFFPSGKLFESTHYVQGIKHGLATKYYETGILSQETPYDSGKINGVQKKYRKDGKIAFEAPYDHDHPCTGLKEYGINGQLKTEYAYIRVDPSDQILKNNKYTLFITMSNDSKHVQYFLGKLKNGNCLVEEDMEIVFSEKYSGVGVIEYDVYPGMFLMKQLNIVAKMKTVQGNYFITQKMYNLSIENR